MKGIKTVWIFTGLSVFSFLVTLAQSATDFGWWSFKSDFIWSLEKFTFFIVNPISMIVCIILSIKLIRKTKSPLYLVTIAIPILSVFFSFRLALIRLVIQIFG